MKRASLAIMLLAVGIFCTPAWSGPVGEVMTFEGTLIAPPPCTISNGNMIDVDFGDKVGVNKVDGVNYLQAVNYTITCTASSAPWSMSLSLNGTMTSFDSAAIKTNIPDLGIQIQQNGQRFVLNKPIPINSASPPILQAVPVRAPGATLNAGAFDATATLLAEFQ